MLVSRGRGGKGGREGRRGQGGWGNLVFHHSLTVCLVCAGMFNISKMKNRPMILIGG